MLRLDGGARSIVVQRGMVAAILVGVLACAVADLRTDTAGDSDWAESTPIDSEGDSGKSSHDSPTGHEGDSGAHTDSDHTGDSGSIGPDEDGDGHHQHEDCDDDDPLVYPGAAEICDQVDNDCDGEADCRGLQVEEAAWAWFFGDYDGAGIGQDLLRLRDLDGDTIPDLIVPVDHGDAPDGTPILFQLGVLFGQSMVADSGIALSTAVDVIHEDFHDGAFGGGVVGPDFTGDGFPDWLAGGDGPWKLLELSEESLWDPGVSFEDMLYQTIGNSGDGLYDEGVREVSDIDGDGDGDLVLGWVAQSGKWSCRPSSKVDVYLGPVAQVNAPSVEGYPDADITIGQEFNDCDEVDEEGEAFGYILSARSDTDGDGLPDMFVGGGEETVSLVLSADLDGDPGSYALEDIRAGRWDGVSARQMESGADVDGDGYEDLALSNAYYEDTAAGTKPGMAWILLGPGAGGSTASGDITDGVLLIGGEDGEYAGSALALIGDADADGSDDLAIGAKHRDGVEESSGRAYLCYGGSPGQLTSGSTGYLEDCHTSWEGASSAIDPGQFGLALAAAGDVNADGFDDLWVGAPYYTNPDGNRNAGALYLLPGFAR